MKNEEAYALVTATREGVRYVLLIETDAGWAMPGGAIEPRADLGSPLFAAKRELRKETGLKLQSVMFRADDPRDGIVVARCDLGEVDALPEVWGGGDHGCFAEWLSLGYLKPRERDIFPAHREILGAL